MKKALISTIFVFSSILLSCFSEEKKIITSFNLTTPMLEDIIFDLDPEIQERILNNPVRFLELAEIMLSKPEELFYLADKNHAVTRNQAPKEVVRPFNYGISATREERVVSSLIISSLKLMIDSARREGLEIVFASGYRPYDYQEKLYNGYVKQLGQAEADRISARPGTSQHQLGTAVDFGTISDEYAETEEGIWLKEHAGDYGFSLSYPDGFESVTGYRWECWHYRYITTEGIEMQREFFSDIQQYLIEFWHYRKDQLQAALIR